MANWTCSGPGGDSIWKGEQASTGKVRLVQMNHGYHDLSLSDIKSVNGVSTGVWAASDAQGIHYTTDGKHWITTAMGMHGVDAMHHTAPSPSDPKIIYAGQESQFYKSVDGGRTWINLLGKTMAPECFVDPKNPSVVYLSSTADGKLLRTSDGGASFQEMGQGRFLAIHPSESGTVYAETPEGLCVSKDGAEHFEKLSDQKKLGDFFISVSDPSQMLSARGGQGLFASSDGGGTWAAVPGVELKGPTRFAESGDGSIWISDLAIGLARSTDRGRTWQKVWDAMGAMAADPWDSHCLYMVTRGGIWWVHPKEVVRQEVIEEPAGPTEPAAATPATIKVAEPLLIDRSNATYELDRDIDLTGADHARSLALLSRGLKNVILDGKGHTVRSERVYTIFGDDVENLTIRNFHFVRSVQEGRRNAGGEFPSVLYLTNCRKLTISNCTFETPGSTCICTNGIFTDNVSIEDCRLVGGSTFGAPLIDGNGRHTIRRCIFEPDGKVSIRLTLSDGSIIQDNTVAENTIVLRTTKDVSMSENQAPAQVSAPATRPQPGGKRGGR